MVAQRLVKSGEGRLRGRPGSGAGLVPEGEAVVMTFTLQVQPELRVEFVSPSSVALSGYAPEEFYADPELYLKVVHPDERPNVELVTRTAAYGAQRNVRRWVHKNGSTIWVETTRVLHYDSNGNVARVQGTARNVTERKALEAAVHGDEARLRRLIENARDIVFKLQLKPHLGFEYVSSAIEEITGKTRQDWLERPSLAFRCIHKDDRERLKAMIRSIETHTEPITLRWVCDDGQTIWLESTHVPVYDDSGQITGVEGIARDVTTRIHAETALRDSEQRFRLLAEYSKDMVFHYQRWPRAQYLYVSPASMAILGYTPDEFYADPDLGLKMVPPDQQLGMPKGRAPTARARFTGTVRCIRKDGTPVWVEVSQAPILDNESKRVVGVRGVIQDVTERLRAEADLRWSNLRLKESRRRIVQAQEGLRRLVSERVHGHVQNRLMVACHYLNQAVNDLRGDDNQAADLVAKAAGIVDEVNSQELREIAWQLHPSPVRIGLRPSLLSLVRNFEDSSSTAIRFRVRNPRKRVLGNTQLTEDVRLAIFRVVEEALNNVRKHAGASEVDLSLEFPRADCVRVTVRDHGRGYNIRTAKPGFGLLCMQDYCDALDGTLILESKVGQGTTVTASFPIPTTDQGAPEAPSRARRLKTA